MSSQPKYARVEWERRFLTDHFPAGENVVAVRRIEDRYIEGTRLRLRRMTDSDGSQVLKLTQKIPEQRHGARQGFITSIYLSREEFGVLSQCPAKTLSKTRHSTPPFGVDVFEGVLEGLILVEAEFDSGEEAASLVIPSFVGQEVTDDSRLTGGSLVEASREDLRRCLADYGMNLA